MKRKYIAVLTGAFVGMSVFSGCAGTNKDAKTEVQVTATEVQDDTDEEKAKEVVGEVEKVEDSTITLKTETQGEEDAKEIEITVTENTVIQKQSGGALEPPQGDEGKNNGVAGGEAPTDAENGGTKEMPEPPQNEGENAQAEEAALSDIAVGDRISATFDENGNVATITIMSAEMGAGAPGGGTGSSGGVESYDAVNEYTEDTEVEGETFTSNGTDENAVHVSGGAEVSLKNSTISRSSADSKGGDDSSFYGVGAALLVTDGTLSVSNVDIDTDANGAAGIFAYGDGTVYAADSNIITKQGTSGGIHAAGGGTLYAWDLTVETNGASSAAIRSDRGGGTMVVDGGSYTSNGTGSPAVYSTADISVHQADLTANGSEAVCIEGLNSLRLFDTNLTGNMGDDTQNDCTWNVILYQSMSGDSEVGNSTFEMDGGTLTAKNGGMFYTTNTESTFILSGVDITYADDSEFFLCCTGNNNQRGWGETGANGADCLFGAYDQEMQGNIIWDSISTLDFYMTDSTFAGAVIDDETYAGNGGDGYCDFYIGAGSSWTVTGDSTLRNLYCAGTITDESGNTVTVKGKDGTIYIEGNSTYTITVDSYENTADMSGAPKTDEWSSYEVERPENL